MTTAATTLFAMPPFPGARPHAMTRRLTAPQAVDPAQALAIIRRLHDEGVAGRFWEDADNDRVFDADDPVALVASVRGVAPFVSGTGRYAALDGIAVNAGTVPDVLTTLFAESVLAPTQFCDPFDGAPSSVDALINTRMLWRDLIAANRQIAAAFGPRFAMGRETSQLCPRRPRNHRPPAGGRADRGLESAGFIRSTDDVGNVRASNHRSRGWFYPFNRFGCQLCAAPLDSR
jgi:hypothetical protein